MECTKIMDKEGCIIYLGLAENLTITDYVEKIKNINIKHLQKMSELNLKFVDGQGCKRITNEMKLLN